MADIEEIGRTVPLTVPRRIVIDLLHFARKIPTIPVQRVMDLSRVSTARNRGNARIGWAAVFTKAFAVVARDVPALRRAYADVPFARLYEHPCSVASVAIEREYAGEAGVLFAYVQRPDELTLTALDAEFRRLKETPVEDAFGFLIKLYRIPRPLRRLGWWYLMHLRPARKAAYLGTFGVSSYAGLGAESLHPLSPLTATINYGILAADGSCPVRIVYDHRVTDGGTIARALAKLELVLNGEIAAELDALAAVHTAVR